MSLGVIVLPASGLMIAGVDTKHPEWAVSVGGPTVWQSPILAASKTGARGVAVDLHCGFSIIDLVAESAALWLRSWPTSLGSPGHETRHRMEGSDANSRENSNGDLALCGEPNWRLEEEDAK